MQGWEQNLARWREAGLIEDALAQRIRDFETGQQGHGGLRWPVMLAVTFGALLLAAGLLLFVAAHWDALSPAYRFTIILATLGALHLCASLAAERFALISTALHGVGTVALGAGIFMAGQIFNLESHWPAGVLMWAAGALAAWALLRDWTQCALVAILVPAWIASEWVDATGPWHGSQRVLSDFLVLLAITYFTARSPGRDGAARRALVWIGGILLLPLVANEGAEAWLAPAGNAHPLIALGYLGAFGLPLALAFVLRGRNAWLNAIAAVWIVLVGFTGPLWGGGHGGAGVAWNALARYGLYALGAIGLVAWGLKESRKGLVNMGVAAFALTVLAFYFSAVMDKLGRSASLIGLGVLFLLGGWALEAVRRRLVARLGGKA
jgi:uncharacterized membrane protein